MSWILTKRIYKSNKLNNNIEDLYFERDNHKCYDTIFNDIIYHTDKTILTKNIENLNDNEKKNI
jgi:hypothetical protein